MKPCLKYAGNSVWKQLWRILSELLEVAIALARQDYEHAAEEIGDVQTSCETLLYIIGYQSVSERNRIRNLVDRKNEVRGYHEEARS